MASVPFSALDGQLRSAIGRVYHNFDLTVDLGQIRSIQIYLAGEARRPGVYTVSALSSLVDALFAGGGPSTQGSLRRIELRRGSEKVTEFDLYDLLVHGDKSKDVKLLPGDVIYIPPIGAQSAIIGSVKSPAIYELLPGETLAQAIANAGGVSAVASAARVSIERIQDRKIRHAMEVAYDETGLKTPLEDGDLIRVLSIVPQYADTVTLRGNLANPGRFAWHPGMRVSSLIPDKESLISTETLYSARLRPARLSLNHLVLGYPATKRCAITASAQKTSRHAGRMELWNHRGLPPTRGSLQIRISNNPEHSSPECSSRGRNRVKP